MATFVFRQSDVYTGTITVYIHRYYYDPRDPVKYVIRV